MGHMSEEAWAALDREYSGSPIYWVVDHRDDQERVVAPLTADGAKDVDRNWGGFLGGPDSRGGRVPPWSDRIGEAIDHVLSWNKTCVVFLSPELRIQLKRSVLPSPGWKIKVRFRCGSGVEKYGVALVTKSVDSVKRRIQELLATFHTVVARRRS